MNEAVSGRLPKDSSERYRREMGLQGDILDLLRGKGPLTIREIAEALGIEPQDAMMYVMAMRRYGLLKELPKERRERFWKYGVADQ